MTRRLTLFLAFLLLAGLLAPIHAATYSDPWPLAYSNWQYRRPITINNPNSNDLTDFQVKITLDSSFDFSKANSDGSDIRFADAAGNTIPYYIESWDSTNRQAVIWIKVPSIPASSTVTVYMYYGNPSATSESNGDAVFDFFDDFDGTSIDTSKWDSSGTVTISSGVVEINSGNGYIKTKDTFQFVTLDFRLKLAGRKYNIGFGNTFHSPTKGVLFVDDGSAYKLSLRGESSTTDKTFTPDTVSNWHVYTLRWGQSKAELLQDYVSKASGTTNIYQTPTIIGFQPWGSYTGPLYLDWVRVRKYAEQEPTARIGTEELNNPVTVTFHFLDDAGNALDGVTVLVDGIQYTLNDGDSVVLVDGTHTFEAQKQHYVSVQKTLDVESDITLTLVLNRQSYTVYFYAYDENNRSIDGFNVYANAHNLGIFNSGDSATLKYGTYIFRFKKEHYKSILMTKIIDGNGVIVNFTNVQLDNVNKITLYFYDMLNNLELNNVTIWIDSQEKTLNTGATIILREGTHKLVFEKQGYLPRGMTLNITEDMTLVIYFVLANQNHTVQLTNNFTMPDINGTGWSGWQIGKEALSLNFDKAIQLFFTENPNSQAQAFLPFAIWIGMTILGLVFSQSPLVALTLGVITQASLAGLGAKVDMRLLPGVVTLYLFLFIWILKDFIESRKAD